MRSTLSLMLGIVCLIDIGMIFFLNAPWYSKVILVPVIGFTCITCFAAGHYKEEAKFKSSMILLLAIILVYWGIFFLLPTSQLGKMILFTSLCLSSLTCYSLGHRNNEFNNKYENEYL